MTLEGKITESLPINRENTIKNQYREENYLSWNKTVYRIQKSGWYGFQMFLRNLKIFSSNNVIFFPVWLFVSLSGNQFMFSFILHLRKVICLCVKAFLSWEKSLKYWVPRVYIQSIDIFTQTTFIKLGVYFSNWR